MYVATSDAESDAVVLTLELLGVSTRQSSRICIALHLNEASAESRQPSNISCYSPGRAGLMSFVLYDFLDSALPPGLRIHHTQLVTHSSPVVLFFFFSTFVSLHNSRKTKQKKISRRKWNFKLLPFPTGNI